MRAVRLGRAHGDEEHLRDLLVRVPEREQAQHLALALRERILLRAPPLLGVGGEEPRAEAGMHVPLARRDRADRADDLGVGGLLQHVAARTRVERLAHVARVVLHREHEHLRVGHRLQQRRHALDPALARHHHVEQHDVGLVLDRLEDRPLGVRRLADRLDVLLRVEHAPQAGPDDRMVVDDRARGWSR